MIRPTTRCLRMGWDAEQTIQSVDHKKRVVQSLKQVCASSSPTAGPGQNSLKEPRSRGKERANVCEMLRVAKCDNRRRRHDGDGNQLSSVPKRRDCVLQEADAMRLRVENRAEYRVEDRATHFLVMWTEDASGRRRFETKEELAFETSTIRRQCTRALASRRYRARPTRAIVGGPPVITSRQPSPIRPPAS
jgi:hypothetical protein